MTGAVDLEALLLARMSWRDKLDQLQIVWRPSLDEAKALARRGIGCLFWPGSAAAANELQRVAVEESPHGIPLLIGLDVVHGQFTAFPTPLAQAASFDPAVAEADARTSAAEARSGGVTWTFSPMVDVSRDPRWGRVVEGFGESPYLTAVLGAAKARAYQGDSLAAHTSLLACLKHYVGYGFAEGGRDYNTVDVSEQRLRNVLLEPFRAGVAAGAGSVMASFNTLSGVPMHGNRRLLTDVLKDEWGFGGIVVGDAEGVAQLVPHGVARDGADAVRMAIAAGVDVEMGGTVLSADGEPVVGPGELDEARVDDAVLRILRLKVALGLFDSPYVDEAAELTGPTEATMAAARTAAERSVVLVKNEGGVLPVAAGAKRILLTGPYATSTDHLGAWVQHFAARSGSLDAALRAELPEADLTVLPGTDFLSFDPALLEEVRAAAVDNDLVVVAVGEPSNLSGEAASRSDLRLPGDQERLIHAIADSGVPFVVLLLSGRPLDVSGWIDRAPAVLHAFHLGLEAPAALARVLTGVVNPGGRLPMSFPRSVGQVPVAHDDLSTGRPARTGGSIGPSAADVALVGPGNLDDHFTSKYLDLPLGPQLEFGHGLSYTRFALDDVVLDADEVPLPEVLAGRRVEVSVDVRNVGEREGDDVLLLFVRDLVASIAQPVQRLRGFERLTVAAGQSRTVRFSLGLDDLGFWTNEPAGELVVEPGDFLLTVTDGTTSLNLPLRLV
jgi:beta-glucosidase